MRTIIKIEDGVTRHPDWRMREPVRVTVNEGEQIALVGDNSAGKSRLVEILTGHYPLLMNEVQYDFHDSPFKLASENLKYISFRDSYGEADGTYYYQQRWNQHDIDENMPTVGRLLDEVSTRVEESMTGDGEERERQREQRHAFRNRLYALFHLDALLDKYIISLSSGELRKLQLTRILLGQPRVLIMDNPFIGLDAKTRQQLKKLLQTLIQETTLTLILVLSRADDIPSFITHVIPVTDLHVGEKRSLHAYRDSVQPLTLPALSDHVRNWITNLPHRDLTKEPFYPSAGGEILKFNHVGIVYGTRTILHDLEWTVREGEHWALCGENGSGKSTLLSLVCADNPQAYACNIELFGHRRGSGESIWEIKRHIGYVSPEMHRAYLKDIPAIDIVASGLHDTVGLYARPKPEQRETCRKWMEVFGIAPLENRTFLRLSSGEQRLCLLARAFVKDPELLILDEPLHGLDNHNRQRVREIIEAFCLRPHKTLVMVTHYEEELPPCIRHRLTLCKYR